MTQNGPNNGKANSSGRAQQQRKGTARGKHIRVEPTRRKRVDPDMIALCYWLIAQRIVQEADDDSATAERPPRTTATDDPATDPAAAKGARS